LDEDSGDRLSLFRPIAGTMCWKGVDRERVTPGLPRSRTGERTGKPAWKTDSACCACGKREAGRKAGQVFAFLTLSDPGTVEVEG